MNKTKVDVAARPFPDFPGYFVSPSGDVYSTQRGCEHILSPIRKHSGHLRVHLCRDGVRAEMFVHRLVLLTFVGPPSEGEECRHLNGDPADNRLTNLRWGSHVENCADMVRHGTSSRGEGNGSHKLTEEQVLEIRRLRGSQTQQALAKQYGVARATISEIELGNIWAHLEGDKSR